MAPRSSSGSAQPRWSALRLALAAMVLAGASLLGGWWLGQRSAEADGSARSRQDLQNQAALLSQELSRGNATPGQQQRLLQLLLALDRKEDATALLERMADQQPERWSLRLMLAELRRDRQDPVGAEREVRQLLNLKPDRIEALQLLALLQFEQGRGPEAESRLTEIYRKASREQRRVEALSYALLLADLQQRLGRTAEADALYRRLAADNPNDPRPVLARALLKQQLGQTQQALDLLDQARRQRPDQRDPRLDAVATAWGLAPLRRPQMPKAPGPPSPGSTAPPGP